MEHNRPRGRERQISGPGKSVHKRGSGLGGGPVGSSRPPAAPSGGSGNGGTRSGGARGGGFKLILLLLALLLGGGGGLTAFLGGQTDSAPVSASSAGGSADWASVLGGLGGGSVSSGWESTPNTGHLNETVHPDARARYTTLLGQGRDTMTIMVYMCGTDLESRSGMGTADLQEMLDARFGSEVRLLVCTGGCKAWKNSAVSSAVNQIWQVREGRLVNLEADLGSVSMTDPAFLSDYIRWCAANFPANRYALILWDHGGGSVSGYGYDEKFASSGSMDLAGVDQALRTAGVRFDFVGFDACLMATAETALTLTRYADYLIASEETEPGVGWYYTDWLTELGRNPSCPTVEIGRNIVDSFVDTCAAKCPGQLTTLSVLDLAEVEATLPKALADFSASTARLLEEKRYQAVSNARSGAREFARSSGIDQVDFVHLARNLGTAEGEALAEALLGAVRYNRTSSNMTNAYGVSVYFPYRKSSTVDKAAAAYRQIGLDEGYIRCIRAFAGLEVSGQAASGGTASPLPSLLGQQLAGALNQEDIAQLLTGLLGGSFGRVAGLNEGNTAFLDAQPLSQEETARYLAEHRFPAEALLWQEDPEGRPVLHLTEDQWALVQELELNVFYDDGEGYIDLGLDNVFRFDGEGGLLGEGGDAWLAVQGQPVAYYHTATVDSGAAYSITGRAPVLHNGVRSELLLAFDNEHPQGYVSGIQTVYPAGETETAAKSQASLVPGDTLEFLCDYYGYDGTYQDSYLLGEPVTVPEGGLEVGDVPLEGETRACYRFTDLYNQHYWTPPVP